MLSVDYRVRFFNYLFFLVALSASFMSAATSDDPLDYKSAPGRKSLEILLSLMTLWFIIDEISELKR